VSPGEGSFEFHEVLGFLHQCSCVLAVVQTHREKLDIEFGAASII
jgi:hypothetical protein